MKKILNFCYDIFKLIIFYILKWMIPLFVIEKNVYERFFNKS